jgi:hypothetical protein
VLTLNEQYITGAEGKRIKVVLDIADYQRLLEALEGLDDLRVFDEAQAPGEETVPLERAIAEIERGRWWRTRLRSVAPHNVAWPSCHPTTTGAFLTPYGR